MVIPADLSAVHRHLEARYPEEGCGVVFRRPDGTFRAVPLDNVYDVFRAKDPARYPRTNRTAYLFHPLRFQQATDEADQAGEVLTCIFHSHCDVGAYFSAEDTRQAAPDGEPLFPGVAYLVVAVDQAKVTGQKLFAFQGGEFKELSQAQTP